MINSVEKTPLMVNISQKPVKPISFKGKDTEAIKKIVEENFLENKGLKWLHTLKSKAGEKFNIIMNAIGTGLIAPIFIAFNPISKEDKDTKTYSALRQPISAVLAILTQVGICIQIDKIISNLTSEGKLGEALNASIDPAESYLKAKIKKNSPSISKDKLKEKIESIKDKIRAKAETFELRELMKKEDFKNLSVKQLESKASKIVADKISSIKGNIKAFSVIVGILSTLAITPLTCSLLNWIYPRFMDLFFPNLSKTKKGGHK